MNESNDLTEEALDSFNVTPKVPSLRGKKKLVRAPLDQTSAEVEYKSGKLDSNRHYRIANVEPGRIEELEELGYRVESADLMARTLKTRPINNQLEMGRKRGSQKAIVMSCPKHEKVARDEEIAKTQQALLNESVEANAYEGQKQPKFAR